MKEQKFIIGIGAQKAGTTWLANYFSHHPEILMSPIKELHFFDVQYRPDLCEGFERRMFRDFKNFVKKIEYEDLVKKPGNRTKIDALYERAKMDGKITSYKNFFKRRVKEGQICCEITPEYALLGVDGYKAIQSLSKDVKVIFLMRNPVDRFWSALRMWNKKNPSIDLNQEIDKFLANAQFVERTEYDKTIQNVSKVFDSENMYVEFYENLFLPESLKKICSFSGITYIEPDFDKRVHEGTPKDIDPEIRNKILHKFGYLYQWANEQYGSRLPESWASDLKTYTEIQKL